VDEAQWQAGIRYVRLESARGVHDLLARFRVTHAVTGRAHSDSGGHGLSGELAFSLYLDRHARRMAQAGDLTLWELPAEPPAEVPYGDALALTCNQSVEPGLYAFGALSRARPLVTVEGLRVQAELLGRAELVAIEDGCGFELPEPEGPGHRGLGARGAVRFLVRGAPAPASDVSGVP